MVADAIHFTEAASDKIYIHPDCHEMLKPRIGDLCKLKGNPDYDHYELTWELVLGFSKEGGFITDNSEFNPGYFEQYFEAIIQRDGKAFFMPEIEQ